MDGNKEKKRKIDREHRVRVRWLHYNRNTKTFDSVRQKNGGGNRYIAYSASTPPSLNDLKIKASNLFFPEGKSVFAGPVDNMSLSICDMTQTAIFDFPNNGTLDDFLKEKGMYPSTTYFFLRSQPKDTIDSELEDDLNEVNDTVGSAFELENTTANPIDTNPPAQPCQLQTPQSPIPGLPTSSCSQPLSPPSPLDSMYPPRDATPPAAPLRELEVHRSYIRKDLIAHFKDPSIMECVLVFKMINERGQTEKGAGISILREVFTLFWKEFSISMTIGERERVPFVRHDHFIEEWEAIGRILVKGYICIKYYPLFLSAAFMCYCLFGNPVPDNLLLNSFLKYLAPDEEKLLQPILETSSLPSNREEFDDFLERFNCRTLVSNGNCLKVLLEIAQQELIQKPHLMIASWQSICNQLKLYPAFQTIAAFKTLYDSLLPTTKKVLDMLVANPTNDAERDALKFLQRFIRGLEMSKLVQFLRFTTATDVIVGCKLNISFVKSEGLSSRPIAHTCGPVLELPCSYANYVELREQFANILSRDNWEMDIV